MGGTTVGGLKAAAKNKAKDPDFYRKIGAMGGSVERKEPRGFAAMDPAKLTAIGKKGGGRSRRQSRKRKRI